MKRNILCAAGGLLIILGAILLTIGGYYALLAPDLYQSSVRFRSSKDPTGLIDPKATYDPYWIQTEFEKIQSKSVLYVVITNLNLHQQWAKPFREKELPVEVAYRLLKQQIETRQPHGTSLINVQVTSANKLEAARIANEIARVYGDQRRAAFSNAVNVQLRDSTLNTANQEQALSRNPLFEIGDPAEPALRPFFPNRPLAAGVALLGLLFISGGLVLLARAVRHPSLLVTA